MSEGPIDPAVAFAATRHPNVHFDPLSLGGGVTIDTSGNDNGFLACARTGWSSPPGDSTYVQAAANLARYGLSTRDVSQLVLVGHGNSGLISTGDGMLPSTPTGYISAGTYQQWASSFAQLRDRGTFFTLCGCDCAVGAAGALFLTQLANLLDRPVRGRTGLVYLTCPGAYISYENGSVWQVAQPGSTLQPIEAPQYAYDETHVEFQVERELKLALNSIASVELRFSARSVTVVGAEAGALVRAANMHKKVHIPGSIGAVITAELLIKSDELKDGGRIQLRVYNDRIVQLANEPYSYYFCSAAFGQQIQNLRSALL